MSRPTQPNLPSDLPAVSDNHQSYLCCHKTARTGPRLPKNKRAGSSPNPRVALWLSSTISDRGPDITATVARIGTSFSSRSARVSKLCTRGIAGGAPSASSRLPKAVACAQAVAATVMSLRDSRNCGQGDRKRSSGPGFALHGDLAVVFGDDVVAEGQAQAAAFARAAVDRAFGGEEGLED